MWTAKLFDRNKGGSQAGMCLKNTRLGYGIPSFYLSAWDAWLHTEQHKDRNIPAGIDVPVFFWYKNEANGHIGVKLADGRFWSDGSIYKSIENYESYHEPDYVGWGESINNVKVLTKGGEMKPSECKTDEQFTRFCYNAILFRDANAGEVQARVGQSCLTVVTSLMASQEWKDIQFRQADYPRLQKEFEDYKKNNTGVCDHVKVSEFFIKKG